ncbi:MAG TPA: ABC transporter ATP-binding protein [Vicinamibacterales bacterium]|nr:ABC transporter ATP-binding protein [Vicinamibacterales bacterium]
MTPAIRLDGVSKSFGSKRVLDDVSVDVQPGEGLGILGRSGTGKSVTLKHIVGLVKPDRGRVYVEGRDITGMSSRELASVRRRMGFVFQNGALFDSISVGENVAFVLRRHTTLSDREIRSRAAEKLARVGLEHDYEKMPAALSGGMRKRAGLARAMALDPPILLVDEPSAGLDPITSGEIDDLLLDLKQNDGTTVVIVTHNMPSARKLADRLVMLHDGRVCAAGTPAELERSDDPLVQAFLHSTHSG